MKKFIRFLIFSSLCFTSLCTPPKPPKDPNNKESKPYWWQSNKDYKLSEKEARKKTKRKIKKRFRKIISLFNFLPFKSQKKIDKIKMDKQELKEIENLAEEEINSKNNYKKFLCREPFVKYETKIIKKPIKKIIIEWKEEEKQIPVTEFKEVERKKYNENKLTENLYNKIETLILNKSYDYALKKTKNSKIANLVKKEISDQLQNQINKKNASLMDYIGKTRESKIDKIIEDKKKPK